MKTKNLLKTLMALLFTVLPSIVSAQGDLALFDLKGKVKQCTWVNHKAGCLQKGFSKTANKEVITFSQAGRCQKWNDILFAAQGRSGNALHNEINEMQREELFMARCIMASMRQVRVKRLSGMMPRANWLSSRMRMLVRWWKLHSSMMPKAKCLLQLLL